MKKTTPGRLLVAALLIVAVILAFVLRGSYDVAATVPHTQLVHSFFETAMRYSVKVRAKDIQPPRLDSESMLARGAACYRDSCVQCHGGPGVAPNAIGLGLQPLPGPLVDAARRWKPVELYWITRYGIKMTGMPAWQFRLPEEDLWAVVAFLERLAHLTPAQYAEQMAAIDGARCTHPPECSGGDCPSPQHDVIDEDWRYEAKTALGQYACSACHVIPGVVGPETHVGPSLDGIARRAYLAGRLPNTPDNLVRWIRDPQAVDRHTAMPNLRVTEEHARLMARYLATLR